ncbi:hypothetical protein PX699_06770 [Sphingobium sp. H39-3-25]|uniref:hypothetical protein n=1 Tax=Sphingobium arseniciresistens TaxID=3030834 RepID=UPI0023B97DE3|nr:hypothetical protein [Sphingobium arseniciresistens]
MCNAGDHSAGIKVSRPDFPLGLHHQMIAPNARRRGMFTAASIALPSDIAGRFFRSDVECGLDFQSFHPLPGEDLRGRIDASRMANMLA